MNLNDFTALRDLEGKRIVGDIRFTQKQSTKPLLMSNCITIENDADTTLQMNINYNPEIGSKSINVTLVGEGPICRLDVDGANHKNAGRSHKHGVQDEKSVGRSLRDGVRARPELSGKSVQEVFEEFCSLAHIEHDGQFVTPDEADD